MIQLLKNNVNRQLQLFILSGLLLLIFKLIIGKADTIFLKIFLDIILSSTVFFLLLTLIRYENSRATSNLSLIMNVGILNAIIFFVIIFSDFLMSALFENVNTRIKDPGLVYNLVSFLYAMIFVIFLSYVLLTLRHLYFLNQGKNVKIYFNTMLVFFVLTGITNNYFSDDNLSFLTNTFFVVAVLLMFFNSIRISWIAFLPKKDKVYLLILSVIISILFVVNASNSSGDNIHSQMIDTISPSISQFNIVVMVYGAVYFFMLFFTTLFHLPTAEAYDRKAQEVTSLQYFSKLITEVLDFNDLAETVTDITMKVSNSNASWIIWNENDKLVPIAVKNIGFVESEKLSKIISDKTDFSKLISTKTINISEPVNSEYSGQQFVLVSLSPIKTKGEVRGIIVAAKTSGKIFTNDDLSAIETFSDYASVAIENSRLLEESIEKERLEKELDVAREIQKKILPTKLPEYPGLQIASVFIPAFEVGGDYYDFFEINKNRLGFVIADVSGKGISAAFIMAEVKGIFESLSKTIERPKDILIKANDILRNTLDSKSFVSAAYGYIDLKEEKLFLARAGHCPLFLLRGKEHQQIKPTGLGLGLSDNNYFNQTLEEFSINLKENDTIVLYTDGITEAKNEKMEDFGDKHFLETLLSNNHLSAEELSNKIIREVTVFSSNHSQYDDITLVIFRCQQKNIIDGVKEWQNSIHQ
jgi:serine phosphatase RsbU (regulator of sigma subunit)